MSPRTIAPSSISLAIGGGGTGNNLFLLDGGTHNDPAINLNLPVPFPDALEAVVRACDALAAGPVPT